MNSEALVTIKVLARFAWSAKGIRVHSKIKLRRVLLPGVINTCWREKDPFDSRNKEPFEKPF
ncbi:hypothetical protein [Bradyrhizobium sp. 170]|uniref:hypothetical protein n=1 Tax=Bradyrhizobium sp. 170 TaxID=2782641 RepID=UPI001FFECA20|nr:hypothetical protein [Bradyrhizobium sp. 170]UPK01444.1 hypothetical protein IVB05_27705 [Bradyrhizobium sp. 170]